MARADARRAQPRRAALLPRQRSERRPGRDRLQGLLLPLPRLAHRRARLALGAVDDRHGAADRRRADRAHVLHARRRPTETELRELADALYRRIDWRWAQDGGDDDQARLEARVRLPALRLGRLQRGDHALRARAGLADAPARRRLLRGLDGDLSVGKSVRLRFPVCAGRCSSISSRTPGSIFAASGTASCARSAATISRTAGARRCVQREYAQRNPHEFAGYDENCWGLTAVRWPERRAARRVANEPRRLFGYAARGVPYGPDDGTLVRLGRAGLAAVRARDRPARRAQHAPALSRDAVGNRATRAASIRASPSRTARPGSRPATSGSIRASW